jgi:protein required for attachment to host cells
MLGTVEGAARGLGREPMTGRGEQWIAMVDERRARLFRCARTRRGTWRVEEREALRSVWEEDHERHRPAILGRGPATMPPHEAGWGHEAEEQSRRFAHEVGRWLRARVERVGADPLTVFAAPRFLGLLREQLPDEWRRGVRFIETELTRLRPHELAEHPVVVSALQRAAGP